MEWPNWWELLSRHWSDYYNYLLILNVIAYSNYVHNIYFPKICYFLLFFKKVYFKMIWLYFGNNQFASCKFFLCNYRWLYREILAEKQHKNTLKFHKSKSRKNILHSFHALSNSRVIKRDNSLATQQVAQSCGCNILLW